MRANKHIHFNEFDDTVEEVVPVQSEEEGITDSDSQEEEYVHSSGDDEDAAKNDDREFDESIGEDEVLHPKVRVHAPIPRKYRQTVNMEVFHSLQKHLRIFLELEAAAAATLIGRIAEFIGWTMHANNINQETAVEHIVKYPLDVLKYTTMLKGPDYDLKNGTVYNTLLDIALWAKYLSIYDNFAVAPLLQIVAAQQKIESKKKRIDVRRRLSRENLIAVHHWPKNGMKELQSVLMKQQARVDREIVKCANGKELSTTTLGFVNDWIVSLLFVMNPQGRAQAIGGLSLQDGLELCGPSGQVTSTHFKTSAVYGSQAVNCNTMTQAYIEAYVNHIRPYLLGSAQSNILFINQRGMKHQDIGVCVTRLFHTISHYHITTTILRSIFETETAEAMASGTVTAQDMTNVIRNNGHSSATSHNHYMKRKAEDVGQSAKAIHDQLYSSSERFRPPQVKSCVNEDPAYDTDSATSVDEVHSQPRCRRRIDWTEDEMACLTAWMVQFEMERGKGSTKDWRACVKAMTATDVFHSRHLTPTALREAWRREARRGETKTNNKLAV